MGPRSKPERDDAGASACACRAMVLSTEHSLEARDPSRDSAVEKEDWRARGLLALGTGAGADAGGASITGRDSPLSLPRLATPIPQVSCVL